VPGESHRLLHVQANGGQRGIELTPEAVEK